MGARSYFADALPVLAARSKLAAISRLGFANAPLRRHLAEVFARPYGDTGSFLADPTFEAVFGWRNASESMAELEGTLLSPELVRAMDAPPPDFIKDYRFARNQQPYTHQVEAWKILGKDTAQSLIVASGTGSGKTECFLVPILNQLIRQRAVQRKQLVGVKALFLYPLNALISSQRERLRAWTHGFGEEIRFCLYNGNTPERPERAAVQRESPSEVLDRTSLRATPPPMLITNASMLEYMLVRNADAPILKHSQGTLEWVVLDEAHTYVGSQAAEMALLIRRVLLAFGVVPEQVRFVATSATIGDPNGHAGQALRKFLSDVGGIPLERVHLISGERRVPPMEKPNVPAQSSSLSELEGIELESELSPKRYAALVESGEARRIRALFVGDPKKPPVARLSEVCSTLFGHAQGYSREQQHEALRWLDLLSGTRSAVDAESGSGEVFLPLRAHLFHETLSGIWACADTNCTGTKGSELDVPEWPFGEVYFEPRKHCECGSPVYDLVSCGDCGSVHLLGGIDQRECISHFQPSSALDEFELEIESGNEHDDDVSQSDDGPTKGRQDRILIVNRNLEGTEERHIDRETRCITNPNDGSLRLWLQESDGFTVCPVCEGKATQREPLLLPSRIGAPFLLGGVLPTLLEYAPDGEKPDNHPCRGRRLLTFNDSRQGTARIAAKLQQDAERNRVRGLIYHLTLQSGQEQSIHQASEVRKRIREIEGAITPALPEAARSFFDRELISLQAKLEQLTTPVSITFEDLAQLLANQGRDFEYMLKHYRRHASSAFGNASGPVELAKMFLVREFGRRPKRLNNLESMGLVAVHYPGLDGVNDVPQVVKQVAKFDEINWQAFLKTCLDFYVRANGALQISPSWRNWLGIPFPQRQLVPWNQSNVARNQLRWPQVRRSGLKSTLVRLLAHLLKADITQSKGEDEVDAILQAAWDALCQRGLLQLGSDGRVLTLDRLAFVPMSQGWVCPVTRRILDATVKGATPYLPRVTTRVTASCEFIKIPLYEEAFSNTSDDMERIRRGREWLARNKDLENFREQGLWSDLNDRTIELTPYFATAEHSAQQDSRTLAQYEKEFKSGDLNLLSCSTTMEMGIDIGGVSMVAMNNVPPHPANYLQRAGRAGRRREPRSLVMTLCKSNPHDQSVFQYSRWAFDIPLPAPTVSLDSAIIVQRHIHSLLLSRFLAKATSINPSEQTRLTCEAFFLGELPPANDFLNWCRSTSAKESSKLIKELSQLVRHSVLDRCSPTELLEKAAVEMDAIANAWRSEWQILKAEEEEVRSTAGAKSPVFKAVSVHLKRLAGEYLLRELATRGYLPAYGFPTHIAAFDNFTIGQFLSERLQSDGREDNRFRRRELASRDLTTALREYAPGSEVVIDGLVYRSAGLTLNWHVPAQNHEVREIQNIRWAWRCHQCGTSGSSHSFEAAKVCSECDAVIDLANTCEFLIPAGFAVDFYREPTNDVNTQHFVPVEVPWITASGEWTPLPKPDSGRLRVSPRGHVFHQSRGINGTGYAICLECGRAEPMQEDGSRPVVFRQDHKKLRRSKEDGVFCGGSHDAWKVKERIVLGHETWTDVLEIQLRGNDGRWLNDAVAARTIAVVLRDALAQLLGVQSNELGCDVKQAKQDTGERCYSLLVFDRYAAGYSSSAARFTDTLFHVGRKRLLCPKECDSACPHCILDFDQRFAADNLDRHLALGFLDEEWIRRYDDRHV